MPYYRVAATCTVPTENGLVVDTCAEMVTGQTVGCSLSCEDGYHVLQGTQGTQTCDANPNSNTASFKANGVVFICEGTGCARSCGPIENVLPPLFKRTPLKSHEGGLRVGFPPLIRKRPPAFFGRMLLKNENMRFPRTERNWLENFQIENVKRMRGGKPTGKPPWCNLWFRGTVLSRGTVGINAKNGCKPDSLLFIFLLIFLIVLKKVLLFFLVFR